MCVKQNNHFHVCKYSAPIFSPFTNSVGSAQKVLAVVCTNRFTKFIPHPMQNSWGCSGKRERTQKNLRCMYFLPLHLLPWIIYHRKQLHSCLTSTPMIIQQRDGHVNIRIAEPCNYSLPLSVYIIKLV